MLKLNRVRS